MVTRGVVLDMTAYYHKDIVPGGTGIFRCGYSAGA